MKNRSETRDIHIISGLRFNREVSCDQKSGIDPRFWMTELICVGNPSGTSSNTICSVSTSLATRPSSFTPLFRYLHYAKKKVDNIQGFTYIVEKRLCNKFHLYIKQEADSLSQDKLLSYSWNNQTPIAWPYKETTNASPSNSSLLLLAKTLESICKQRCGSS